MSTFIPVYANLHPNFMARKQPNVRRKTKYHGNISLLYPQDMSQKIAPTPIIQFLNYDGTFHQNMKVFLTISQLFSLMPVNGISAATPYSLHYSFRSLRTLYAILIIAANVAHASVIVYFNIVTGYTFEKILPLLWFTANPFVMYQFIRIARKWPSLMQHWQTFEMTIARRDEHIHKRMRKVMFIFSIGIPTLAFIEHAFSLANNVNKSALCKSQTDKVFAYFTGAFPAFFYFFNVNYVSGITLQLVNLYTTFAWSMTDAFIMLVSLGLVTQFRHFNKHFSRCKGMRLPEDICGKQRLYFTKLTELLDHVNTDLAVLILASFSTNTFYVCLQLYESIAPGQSTLRRIYFWYSLFFLIGKTFLVSMIASFINDESKKPIKVLESLPAAAYGSEAARFMHQLTTGTIALGGMQFFYITRTFIISVTGTIATYEIVLMQLKKPSQVDIDPCEG